ncbi:MULTISPECIES: hypothetical protein [Shewanella]|uniref:hypothetical protein n=1 Tax=Shewanella TaxID=22 RepID=UPI00217DBF84|nr:hypothetical protein [Shewanella xiamenensis]MCT8869325.1 hypothetical protein [Shewanella xiamenensis]MCT8873832.1 hypothetical protein [Shewanella xiamenensis]MCT8877492.1 hypothetical protein [Shewanella xiamenensis]UWH39934.1 hypothetical protein KXJ80_00070 [Shewanella xiamenensis]
MMNANPMNASIKLVYSNDIYDIYISTNTSKQIQANHTKQAFLYFKGEFYNMRPNAGVEICSRTQTEFLLSIMTRFGSF